MSGSTIMICKEVKSEMVTGPRQSRNIIITNRFGSINTHTWLGIWAYSKILSFQSSLYHRTICSGGINSWFIPVFMTFKSTLVGSGWRRYACTLWADNRNLSWAARKTLGEQLKAVFWIFYIRHTPVTTYYICSAGGPCPKIETRVLPSVTIVYGTPFPSPWHHFLLHIPTTPPQRGHAGSLFIQQAVGFSHFVPSLWGMDISICMGIFMQSSQRRSLNEVSIYQLSGVCVAIRHSVSFTRFWLAYLNY